MHDASSRSLAALNRELEEASEQARLAYEFAPSSYSYSALSACRAGLELLRSYRGYLEDLSRTCD